MHANMVGDNFFQSTKLPSIPCPALSVFIAWLNLDLGIETYFTDGLNPWFLGNMHMAAVCVCLYGGNTQYTFHLHTSKTHHIYVYIISLRRWSLYSTL